MVIVYIYVVLNDNINYIRRTDGHAMSLLKKGKILFVNSRSIIDIGY
jgi:hypothetical protein